MKRCIFIALCFLYQARSQEWRLDHLVLFGNTRTRKETIVREFRIRPGDRITPDLLSREREWLLRLDFLKRIEFQYKPGPSGALMVLVEEKGCWSATPSLGNDPYAGWIAGGRITARNLWGHRHEITATLLTGGMDRFGILYRIPWFGGGLRLFSELEAAGTFFRYRYPDVPESFEYRETRMLLRIGKQFGRLYRLGASAGGLSRDAVPDSNAINRKGVTGFLEVFGELDSRDWPRYPFKGLYARVWNLWLWTPGATLAQTGFDLRAYLPLAGNVLAMQVWSCLGSGSLPVYDRIHLGGGGTIRGMKQGGLVGDSGWFASAEYRIPVAYERRILSGIHFGVLAVLFLDTGAAWFCGGRSEPEAVSAGLGIHGIWDRYMLRIEYGYSEASGFFNVATSVKF